MNGQRMADRGLRQVTAWRPALAESLTDVYHAQRLSFVDGGRPVVL